MNIGEEDEQYVIEPLENPVPREEPSAPPEPTRHPARTPDPDKVEVAQ
jgi:hypothetical protein